MAADLHQQISFSKAGNHGIPQCSDHDAGTWTKLKLTIDGHVWVSEDGFRLQCCPVCLHALVRQRFDTDPDTVVEAAAELLRSTASDDAAVPTREFMRDLGPGEITDEGIRLLETPAVSKIPAWIIKHDLRFLEGAVDDDYREAFRDRFSFSPETVDAEDVDQSFPVVSQ